MPAPPLDFDALVRELDLWADAGRVVSFWWRDDDAVALTPALTRLLDLSDAYAIEVAIAAVPARADETLADAVGRRRHAIVLQHGYAHKNHAPPGAPAVECGGDRPVEAVLDELAAGRRRLTELLGARFDPILAAPWNRIERRVLERLGEAGFRGASAYGPRAAMAGASGLAIANAHVDPVNWRERRFAGRDKALSGILGELSARRTGTTEADEPLGLLTHHLDHDSGLWEFLDGFFRVRTRASSRTLDRHKRGLRHLPSTLERPMSIVVRPAEEGDIDPVVDLLFDNMSQKVPKERWRRLLDYPWRPPDAGRGFVALDGDRPVGFLGLVYADRPIDGRIERFCNICAWYLLKAYRGQGIGQKIQFGSVADPAMTYTIMTATAATGRAFGSNSGFQVLDDARYLLRRRPGARGDVEVIDDLAHIEPLLGAGDRTILNDHRPYNLRHLLVRAGEDACYIVMQVKRKGADIDYHEVMYASDRRVLAAVAQAIADTILPSDSAVFAIDRRFLPAPQDWESETIRLPRWFRSPHVAPARIDHLYGEVALLDLKLP